MWFLKTQEYPTNAQSTSTAAEDLEQNVFNRSQINNSRLFCPGDLSREYLTSCPLSAGIRSSPCATLKSSLDNGWIDGWTYLSPIPF